MLRNPSIELLQSMDFEFVENGFEPGLDSVLDFRERVQIPPAVGEEGRLAVVLLQEESNLFVKELDFSKMMGVGLHKALCAHELETTLLRADQLEVFLVESAEQRSGVFFEFPEL